MNSKELIQNLLPGWNGRQAAHFVCYNGNGAVHRGIPYNANDPKVIAKQLELMQSDGVDIVIGTWQGIYAAACNENAMLVSQACSEVGLQFMLLLDPWCAKLSANGQNTNYTANVTSSLQAKTTQTMLNASSYVPEKYILAFNTGANLTQLEVTFKGFAFLEQGTEFSWISIPKITDSPVRNAAAVSNLKAQHTNPAMKVASYCSSFDDSGQPLPVGVSTQAAFDSAGGNRNYSNSVWGGPTRILESFSGELETQCIQTINPTTSIIARLTWNDYDEQSSGPREKEVAEEQGVNWSSL
jgi:hypothetical protein